MPMWLQKKDGVIESKRYNIALWIHKIRRKKWRFVTTTETVPVPMIAQGMENAVSA